ncbi:kinesin 8A [Monocercomonoides exilis]|uniref:kinesin 8A n=1 Tax=Monocercomonoides exilis TaxID=2049356 RepID=UPI0035599B51|nr:kinesin 8A [Monocercomonoides exilis]|eukprot:MONOS_1919.1-p1 / transcript=MONOS_1919.1 / gene=MONOS_1919 / organism=Monocercomonoides_exilis_PA203 / gene_product=kinesin 8A / transcript_product=kinesin 8A / location=Mono_scaffold00036:174468-178701(-) / protein_length=1368 / sequence_SO=supercontig / SO=protein_coding / is_pseudo=false
MQNEPIEEFQSHELAENKLEQNERMNVVVRARPETIVEHDKGQRVLNFIDDCSISFNSTDSASGSFQTVPNMKKASEQVYTFDHVFDSYAGQEEVYKNSAKKIVPFVFDGFNCSIFAYGATGSGKTYTMLGNEIVGLGIIPRVLNDIYSHFKIKQNENDFHLFLSYMEVYNEKIRDLLNDSTSEDFRPFLTSERNLEIREDVNGGISVCGLSVHSPSSIDEALSLISFGNRSRAVASTEANALSSRSHAILQITIESMKKTKEQDPVFISGKLSLIDLAGSERASVTQNKGQRMREGANINRSLLALGNCINALSEGKQGVFVPYRDSKLTRLLKDSLGGTAKSVMIANVSPSSLCSEDTKNTLKYANRAKNIKVKAIRNSSPFLDAKRCTEIINSLRTEIDDLKLQLSKVASVQNIEKRNELKEAAERTFDDQHIIAHSSSESSSGSQQTQPETDKEASTKSSDEEESETEKMKQELNNLFTSRCDVARQIVETSTKLSSLSGEIKRKRRFLLLWHRMNPHVRAEDSPSELRATKREMMRMVSEEKKCVSRKKSLTKERDSLEQLTERLVALIPKRTQSDECKKQLDEIVRMRMMELKEVEYEHESQKMQNSLREADEEVGDMRGAIEKMGEATELFFKTLVEKGIANELLCSQYIQAHWLWKTFTEQKFQSSKLQSSPYHSAKVPEILEAANFYQSLADLSPPAPSPQQKDQQKKSSPLSPVTSIPNTSELYNQLMTPQNPGFSIQIPQQPLKQNMSDEKTTPLLDFAYKMRDFKNDSSAMWNSSAQSAQTTPSPYRTSYGLDTFFATPSPSHSLSTVSPVTPSTMSITPSPAHLFSPSSFASTPSLSSFFSFRSVSPQSFHSSLSSAPSSENHQSQQPFSIFQSAQDSENKQRNPLRTPDFSRNAGQTPNSEKFSSNRLSTVRESHDESITLHEQLNNDRPSNAPASNTASPSGSDLVNQSPSTSQIASNCSSPNSIPTTTQLPFSHSQTFSSEQNSAFTNHSASCSSTSPFRNGASNEAWTDDTNLSDVGALPSQDAFLSSMHPTPIRSPKRALSTPQRFPTQVTYETNSATAKRKSFKEINLPPKTPSSMKKPNTASSSFRPSNQNKIISSNTTPIQKKRAKSSSSYKLSYSAKKRAASTSSQSPLQTFSFGQDATHRTSNHSHTSLLSTFRESEQSSSEPVSGSSFISSTPIVSHTPSSAPSTVPIRTHSTNDTLSSLSPLNTSFLSSPTALNQENTSSMINDRNQSTSNAGSNSSNFSSTSSVPATPIRYSTSRAQTPIRSRLSVSPQRGYASSSSENDPRSAFSTNCPSPSVGRKNDISTKSLMEKLEQIQTEYELNKLKSASMKRQLTLPQNAGDFNLD